MEITLKQSPKTAVGDSHLNSQNLIIEKYDIKFPFSLNINQIFPQKVMFVHGDATIGNEETNDYVPTNFKSIANFFIDVSRKIEFPRDYRDGQTPPYSTIPVTKYKQYGLYNITTLPKRPLYFNKVTGGYIQNDNLTSANIAWADVETAPQQQCLFNTHCLCYCQLDEDLDHKVVLPQMKELKPFLFKNFNDAKKSLRFNYRFAGDKTVKFYKTTLHLRMLLEFKDEFNSDDYMLDG